MLKRGILIGAAALVAIVLAVGGASEPLEVPEANVADCGSASGSAGSMRQGRRRGSVVAGPVGVGVAPLRRMTERNGGQLYVKMPLLVTGDRFVVLSVPLALRNRVFLYFGRIADAEGRPAPSIYDAPGYSETEFQPCRGRRRTLWRGSLRVVGRGSVNLLVTVEGHSRSQSLPLGRPQLAGGH